MRLVHDFCLPQAFIWAFIWGLTNYRTSFSASVIQPTARPAADLASRRTRDPKGENAGGVTACAS